MSNTHSAFIKLSDDSHAFIDGIPDKCQHKWNGDRIYYAASGKTIYWHTYRQWASFTSQARESLIYSHHAHIEDPIIGGTICCSLCKKPFSPEILDEL